MVSASTIGIIIAIIIILVVGFVFLRFRKNTANEFEREVKKFTNKSKTLRDEIRDNGRKLRSEMRETMRANEAIKREKRKLKMNYERYKNTRERL